LGESPLNGLILSGVPCGGWYRLQGVCDVRTHRRLTRTKTPTRGGGRRGEELGLLRLCAGNNCGCRPESMDSAPEMMCRWVERHPLTKARIGGAARPACRPATTITIPTSKPRLLTTRAASMPVSLRDKFKPGGSPSLPQSLRHTRISLFYPRRRLQGYISADERCSDEAWAIGTAYALRPALERQ
jgi:hypothetical protein